MSKITEAELFAIMAEPEYLNRLVVRVYEKEGGYTCEVDGVEYSGSNPFQLDSRLTAAGVAAPRNLFLMEEV